MFENIITYIVVLIKKKKWNDKNIITKLYSFIMLI